MKYLLRRNNVLSFSKNLAKYQNFPMVNNTPFPKTGNPWDNMDPGRFDKDFVDEYG